MSRFILDELDVDDISVHFWTDSMTVLRYWRNVATRFKIFVAHRVQQIQDASDVNAWNYVPSEKNPADLASRGISPIEDDKLKFWLGGPQFLRENTEYTRLFEEPIDGQSDLEVRSTCASEVLADAERYHTPIFKCKETKESGCMVEKILQVHARPECCN